MNFICRLEMLSHTLITSAFFFFFTVMRQDASFISNLLDHFQLFSSVFFISFFFTAIPNYTLCWYMRNMRNKISSSTVFLWRWKHQNQVQFLKFCNPLTLKCTLCAAFGRKRRVHCAQVGGDAGVLFKLDAKRVAGCLCCWKKKIPWTHENKHLKSISASCETSICRYFIFLEKKMQQKWCNAEQVNCSQDCCNLQLVDAFKSSINIYCHWSRDIREHWFQWIKTNWSKLQQQSWLLQILLSMAAILGENHFLYFIKS